MPQPDYLYSNVRMEFICPCGTGHYTPWAGTDVHGCCPNRCCSSASWPGRQPRPGDLALCGHGTLGLVTASAREVVTYPDGHRAEAWVGVHLTSAEQPVLSAWYSRAHVVLEHDIWSLLALKKKGRALAMPHLHLKTIGGWPNQLRYVNPDERKKIMDWLSTRLDTMKEARLACV